jgi:DNA-binding MarR family transcriptional regulator
MSNRHRDEGGRFVEELSEQGILKLFDRADAPFLTAPEIAEEFDVTRQAVTYRLKRMKEKRLVDRKKSGANAVGWWAKVAPRLSEESIARVERSREEIERGEAVALDDL